MSQMGQSRHIDRSPLTSDLPPEMDILRAGRHVSKVPEPELAGILGGLFFIEKSRMVGRPGLPRGKRSDQADDFRVVFLRLLANPSIARFADYLLLELEPVVAEAAAAGGGIMFHVSARYFQSAPSCTTTLMYVPVTCRPPTSAPPPRTGGPPVTNIRDRRAPLRLHHYAGWIGQHHCRNVKVHDAH